MDIRPDKRSADEEVDERASKVRSEVVENWLNVENASFTLQSEFLER